MNWQTVTKTIDLGDGKVISIETGKMARQADGAILLRMGKLALLATVVSSKEVREGQGFFPLSVDYQERFASTGRIPGSFQRREGRLGDHEILISRLVDRTIRPLFPDGYLNETQVIVTMLSADENIESDALAGFAASAALTISDIPFDGPISEVRVVRKEGAFIVNPYKEELEGVDMDIIMGATEENVMMVEGEMSECSEEDLVEAIKVGHEVIKQMCQVQNELRAEAGKEKREVIPVEIDEALMQQIADLAKEKIYEVAKSGSEKHERKEKFKAIEEEVVAHFEAQVEEGEEMDKALKSNVKEYFHKLEKKVIRTMILDEQVRLDGRALDEVRALNLEVDVVPSPHGCSLFCRGETQAFATVTLGSKLDEKLVDKASGLSKDRFLLHYNFLPFSTGEAKFLRSPGRREIGHGNLAMRSLKMVLPPDEENPYTIRIVSDILESNGSSSMATVCSGSMALMDAGVPIRTGVSGIAMGMISDGEKVAVLTDILGDEDHLGDMDFKVTGTKDGICAVQMDIKVDGLPYEVLTAALHQANAGRNHILNQMNEVIAEPREELKPHAPRIEMIHIGKEYIGAVIGTGGKVIQEIQKETNSTINIEEPESGDQATVTIYATDKDSIEKAKNWIKGIVAEPEVGEVYEAVVKSVMPYGAFVEFMPGKQGLLHISEISWKRLESMDDVLSEGEKVKVKLTGVDKRSGKFRLSRKVLMENPYGDSGDNDGGGDYRQNGGGGRDRGDRRGGNDRPRNRGDRNRNNNNNRYRN